MSLIILSPFLTIMPPRKKPVVKTPAIRKTRSQKKAAISPEFIESDASDGSAPEGEASDNLINDSGFLVEDSDDHDASEYDEWVASCK